MQVKERHVDFVLGVLGIIISIFFLGKLLPLLTSVYNSWMTYANIEKIVVIYSILSLVAIIIGTFILGIILTGVLKWISELWATIVLLWQRILPPD